jgi:hypothetical protein
MACGELFLYAYTLDTGYWLIAVPARMLDCAQPFSVRTGPKENTYAPKHAKPINLPSPPPGAASFNQRTSGNVARMTASARRLSTLLGLPVAAAAATFVALMLAAGVVSSLPRPTQGESVRAPWGACMVASLGLSFVLPWVASLPLLRERRLRVYFLCCLASAVAAWWLFGFDDLISKAYGRGL